MLVVALAMEALVEVEQEVLEPQQDFLLRLAQNIRSLWQEQAHPLLMEVTPHSQPLHQRVEEKAAHTMVATVLTAAQVEAVRAATQAQQEPKV